MSKKKKVDEDLSYEMHFHSYEGLNELLDYTLMSRMLKYVIRDHGIPNKISVYVKDKHITDLYIPPTPKEV